MENSTLLIDIDRKTVAGNLESKSISKSLPTSEESLDTSGEVVTINQMSLQDLVSQIEIEVSNESSNNWVESRMWMERSHGDGNNSAKYLSIVPLTAHFLLHMDEMTGIVSLPLEITHRFLVTTANGPKFAIPCQITSDNYSPLMLETQQYKINLFIEFEEVKKQ